MRFTTGLAIAAALIGAEARVRHDSRPYGNPNESGFGGSWPGSGAGSSSVAATSTHTRTATHTAAASTSFVTSVTKASDSYHSSSSSTGTKTSSTTAAAATTSASSSSGSLTTDEQNALDAHNSARSDVGTSALVWDADLAAEAQEWAETIASQGSLTHSSTSNEGENLYMGYDSTPYTSAVAAWVSEKADYSGETISSTNYMTFGHYTQVVWSTTTNVGMGSATSSDGATYVVARYSPPGNYIGETAY